MKAFDYIINSKSLSKEQSKNTESLKKVVALLEKGFGVDEILFDAEVWSDKTSNFWFVDKVESLYQNYLRFLEKKDKYLQDLRSRKEPDVQAIEQIEKAENLLQLEENFRPYKRKKKTKATLAREAGLQIFADALTEKAFKGESFEGGLESEAKKYIQPALGFITYETVLNGAKDILVEKVLDKNPDLRENLLDEVLKKAKVIVKEGEKFSQGGKYSNFIKAPSQACSFYLNSKNYDKFPQIKKGWEDNFLKVTLDFNMSEQQNAFNKKFCSDSSGDLEVFLRTCSKKALEIHALPSVTTEVFDKFYEVSEKVYLSKLKLDYMSLLATPCFGQKALLSFFDKGKDKAVAVFISHKGDFVSSTEVDFSKEDVVASLTSLFSSIVSNVDLAAVALPLGDSFRKYEKLISKALNDINKAETSIIAVDPRGLLQFVSLPEAKFGFEDKVGNETLACFYLGKRAQNPLKEFAAHRPVDLLDLPHFIDKEKANKEFLKVLKYYAAMLGVEPGQVTLGEMKNLDWFNESGEELEAKCKALNDLVSPEKKSLEKVLSSDETSRFSKFFKFSDTVSVLDQARISYTDFSKIKDFLKQEEVSLLKGPIKDLKVNEKWEKLLGKDFANYLVQELAHPFKDFRKPYRVFSFSKFAQDLETLEEEKLYWGVVTKFSAFGAFVDIGVGVEGLIHLSELSRDFISDPRKVLRLGQWVLVKAIKVDKEKKQLSFSKIQAEGERRPKKAGTSKSFKGGKKSAKKFKGPKGGGRSKGNNFRQPKPKTPFNNPFAILGDLNKD